MKCLLSLLEEHVPHRGYLYLKDIASLLPMSIQDVVNVASHDSSFASTFVTLQQGNRIHPDASCVLRKNFTDAITPAFNPVNEADLIRRALPTLPHVAAHVPSYWVPIPEVIKRLPTATNVSREQNALASVGASRYPWLFPGVLESTGIGKVNYIRRAPKCFEELPPCETTYPEWEWHPGHILMLAFCMSGASFEAEHVIANKLFPTAASALTVSDNRSSIQHFHALCHIYSNLFETQQNADGKYSYRSKVRNEYCDLRFFDTYRLSTEAQFRSAFKVSPHRQRLLELAVQGSLPKVIATKNAKKKQHNLQNADNALSDDEIKKVLLDIVKQDEEILVDDIRDRVSPQIEAAFFAGLG